MLIGISGMVACGKSVLSKRIHEHYKTSLLLREFKEDDVVFNKFLEWLYEKRPNTEISFQAYICENHSTKMNEIWKNYRSEKKDSKKDHIIIDRFCIEHNIFARLILAKKGEKFLNAYQAMFDMMIDKNEIPDIAIFLDVNFENFKKRLFKRNRKVEVNNFDENLDYWKELHKNYRKNFEILCEKYKVNAYYIDTNDMTEIEVFNKAVEIIDNHNR
ncbi:Deoxynucleoside kinase [Mycoplasmoides gallisepticum CA06_2006.052-5-2P]|uniref:deoxynucleoside kinase n=1 Tax=Mycoplasmoides gallisepticum TaxID=2096 RepID=UPI0002778EAC|nr:deoxynucleoside kinase [Mycoplasmoides gallisepticum]AFP80597.1 Deoxynucleoside kinase [Mycoplasmoides gallisepticum CA06_2006.052-5-2P]